MSRRVVITGMGLVTPLGHDLETVWQALIAKKSGVRFMPEYAAVDGLATRIAAPIADGFDPKSIKRSFRRSMGPQAMYAAEATRQAIAASGVSQEDLQGGRCGLAIGSTLGSPQSTHDFFKTFFERNSVVGLKGTAFLQCMGHTCAANVAVMAGIKGRVMAPLSACASGTQAVGLAYETIKAGSQDLMLAGGADEAHFTTAITFDLVRGTSTSFDKQPELTPRPFDRDRDGLVVGAGSGMLMLESYDHAQKRGAPIFAELVGYGSTCDGNHMSQPLADGMVACVEAALASAELPAERVDYVNAHATATEVGDATEAEAIRRAFSHGPPVSSQKGHIGHTLGACGALEAIFSVMALRRSVVPPTNNLENVDPACEGLNHVLTARDAPLKTAVSQNFAFGGVNAALVLQKV